jgi:antitoxin VapB
MSLNIKNPETCALAAEVARLTGLNMTAAITEALKEKRARVLKEKGDPELVEDLRRIAHDIASRLSPEVKALDIDELLYDERGLPK